MQITYTQHIDAPIETVFGLVESDEKLKLWMDGLLETTYPNGKDPDNPVGTRFRQKIKEGGRVQEYDGEVTAFERPHHLGIRISSAQFSLDVDYRFEEENDGTRMNYACVFASDKWFIRLMGTMFSWLTKHILKKQMTNLKRVAEQTAEN